MKSHTLSFFATVSIPSMELLSFELEAQSLALFRRNNFLANVFVCLVFFWLGNFQI